MCVHFFGDKIVTLLHFFGDKPMERTLYRELLQWKNSKRRKPLL